MTISRALPRMTADIAHAEPTLPAPTIPIFMDFLQSCALVRRPSGYGAVMSRGPQRGTDLAGRKRHRTQPHPGCLEYDVADHRGHDRAGSLAASPRSTDPPADGVA